MRSRRLSFGSERVIGLPGIIVLFLSKLSTVVWASYSTLGDRPNWIEHEETETETETDSEEPEFLFFVGGETERVRRDGEWFWSGGCVSVVSCGEVSRGTECDRGVRIVFGDTDWGSGLDLRWELELYDGIVN